MPELPEVGDEYAGYLLQAVIGHGAVSVVYEAEHPRLGNGIALKVLAAEVAADEIFRTRFLDESRIAASMNHPHVIPIYDVGESDGLLYIAMRSVSGGDLRQRIATDGPLQPQTAVSLLSQATRALDAAHRIGLVHRNVKPSNLLIEGGDRAGPEHVYLADFGISRVGMERNGLTSTGQFLGTTDYVAPEQITEPYVYGSADQYSLGCVLYECLTGRVPFEKDPDAAAARPALRTDLPPAVEELFARVLAERPDDRYNTCREFMEAASAALADVEAVSLAPAHIAAASVGAIDVPTAPLPGLDARTLAPEPELAGDHAAPTPETGYPAAPTLETSYPAAATSAPGDHLREREPWPAEDQRDAAPEPAQYQRDVRPEPAEYPREVAPEPAQYQRDVASEPAEYQRDLSPERPPLRDPGSSAGAGTMRWLVIAALLLVVCAGAAGAYAALSKPKANASASSAIPTKPKPQRPRASLLTQVLTAADASKVAMGMLPPSTCKQQAATMVVCMAPSPAITMVTFTTYPTLTALFSAYKAQVRSLNHGHYQQNVKDCGAAAPSPYGEIAWNHREQHSRAYTAAEMISGKVSVETAMGRMACIATAGHSEDVVWTTDYGKMLGVAIGSDSHGDVWLWWIAVHHNIIFPGTPMDMASTPPLMAGAPMPTTSSSTSPSMSGGTSPSMSASTAPSMTGGTTPSMSASTSPSMSASTAPSMTGGTTPSMTATASPSMSGGSPSMSKSAS
jgi:serine/threonine-protein kinase